MNSFVIKGTVCYSAAPTEIRTLRGYAVCRDGISCGVYETLPAEFSALPLFDCGDSLVIPGMCDLHIHAAQFGYRGTSMDLELLDWLDNHAFPEESRFAEPAYAEQAYTIFADAMKKSATTRACVFASRHAEATEILMEKMEAAGLVSYVGKVNMDRAAPDPLREPDADSAAADTRAWILRTKDRFANTHPILTPRFIPSCTDSLMKQLGGLRREYSLPVQSHLSENPSEIAWVKELRPDAAFYGDAYANDDMFGGTPTIMSHCVYSSDAEIAMMKERGVVVVHCPASNLNVSSGIAPIRRYLDAGLRVGLGSDVAGGQTESMFRAVTDAIQVSKMYWRHIDQSCRAVTFEEAFHMATVGGGFFPNTGSFDAGYEFDAVVLDESSIPTTVALTDRERLERAFYLGLDRHILHKFVRGRQIL